MTGLRHDPADSYPSPDTFPAKIRCESKEEMMAVQMKLHEEIGVTWRHLERMPWDPGVTYNLIVCESKDGYYFQWAYGREFQLCQFHELTPEIILGVDYWKMKAKYLYGDLLEEPHLTKVAHLLMEIGHTLHTVSGAELEKL